MPDDVYLGDGLHASFDGFQFRLWTERANGVHEVFLEDDVLARFEWFVAQIRKGACGDTKITGPGPGREGRMQP